MTPPRSGQQAHKNYRIYRAGDGRLHCEAVPAGDLFFPSYPVRHIPVHSPTGFEIGYGGSGPSDLALAILADWTGDPVAEVHAGRGRAAEHYQQFKWVFLSSQRLDKGDALTIPGRAVAGFLLEMERDAPALLFPASVPARAPVHNDLG